MTKEIAPFDPAGGAQLKFIARGVGTIEARPLGEPDPETVHLTSAGFLCPSAMDAIRQDALDQDQRGYTVASGVYAGSPPAVATLQPGHC